ncbi:MAG: hypothetical protein K4H23_05120 [Mollicutes bacterium PWAP]|nr:hypothetical protein [Mollicutes bacterium PWAP]
MSETQKKETKKTSTSSSKKGFLGLSRSQFSFWGWIIGAIWVLFFILYLIVGYTMSHSGFFIFVLIVWILLWLFELFLAIFIIIDAVQSHKTGNEDTLWIFYLLSGIFLILFPLIGFIFSLLVWLQVTGKAKIFNK